MIRYCIWDVGKTIYDYSLEPLERWIAARTADPEKFRFGGGLRAYDFDPYMLGKIDTREMCREICERFGVPYTGETPAAVNRELHRGVGRYFAETRRMMAYMRQKGIENAVFSNAMPALADTVGYPELLRPENVFVSYKAGLLKPDPAVYEYVRAKLNCRFEEMIMVDDKPKNVEAARALGMAGVIFRPETAEHELKRIVGYADRAEVENALRNAPKGKAREKILAAGDNRRLIAGSGANVTFYAGSAGTEGGALKRLQSVCVGVLLRRNAKTGRPDGLGALGGLAERTGAEEFAAADEKRRRQLAAVRDDVVVSAGKAALISDEEEIARRNVCREMREELGNLGIYDFKLPAAAFEAADVPGACDDNFAVNLWNGEGHVWAVTPRCFLLKTDARTLERLQGLSEKGRREAFSEARGFCKIRLTEALSRFGKKGGAEVSEDGRDMASDYRYPHEWMVLWILAARELRHDEKLLEEDGGGRDLTQVLHEKGVMSLRLSGPLFFGGASQVSHFFQKIGEAPKVLILRMGYVPVVDATGANIIIEFIKKVKKYDTKIILSNVKKQPRRVLHNAFLKEGIDFHTISIASSFQNALKITRRYLKNKEQEEKLPAAEKTEENV